MRFVAQSQFRFLRHNIEKSCKSSARLAIMITKMPTTEVVAHFFPITVNIIEPAADTKPINDIDDVRLRNVEKYDK